MSGPVVIVREDPDRVVVTAPGPQGPPGDDFFEVADDGRIHIDGGGPATSSGA